MKKRIWHKVEQRENRRKNELLQWRFSQNNDLPKALAYLHFRLIFSFSAFYSFPVICFSCRYISLIYHFLPSALLALHILPLTINLQQTKVKQPVTLEATFILIMACEKLSTFFQALLKTWSYHQSSMNDFVAKILSGQYESCQRETVFITLCLVKLGLF